ncbi:MAG: ANTAR domain-containing protein [Phycisphaerales bacterium]|jgi:response regulator NasT
MQSDGLILVVAHGNEAVRASIAEAVSERHVIHRQCDTVAGLREAVVEKRPDLVVTGVDFSDGDGIETMIELGNEIPVPSVIVTARRSMDLVERAMRDHVMGYLIEPVTKEDIQAAIVVAWSRYRQLMELTGTVESLREAMAHRKVIERAKGLLMSAEGLSEGRAFAKLRSRAQDERARMVDIATKILHDLKDLDTTTS